MSSKDPVSDKTRLAYAPKHRGHYDSDHDKAHPTRSGVCRGKRCRAHHPDGKHRRWA